MSRKRYSKNPQIKNENAQVNSQGTEESFQTSDERYRLLAENVTDTVWLMDMNLKVLYISPSVTRLRGYTLEELNTIPFDQQMTPESFQRAMILLSETLSPENLAQKDKKITASIELEFFKKDGSSFWSENNFVLLRDENGQPVNILSTGRNITERKRATEALRDSENRYRSLIDQAANALFVHDFDGNIVEVNQRASESLGYTQEELLRMNILDIEQDFDLTAARKEWKKIKPGLPQVLFGHQKRKDGSIFPVEVHFACMEIRGQRLVMGLVNDISDRLQAEETIRYHANLIEQITDAIVSTDLDDCIVSWNRGAERLYDWKPEEVLGKSFYQIVKTAPVDDYNSQLLQLVLEQGTWTGEAIQYNRSNDAIIVYGTASLIKDTANKPSGMVTVFRDITEEKRTEDALKYSEARYRSLFVNMLEGYAYCKMIYENDQPIDYFHLDVNPAFEKLTGLSDVIGIPISKVIPGIKTTNPELFESYSRVASTGHPEKIETYIPALDRWFSVSVFSPVRGYFVTVFDNITERKKIEERIRQSEERLSLVLRAAEIGTWDWNLASGEIFASPQLRTLLGLSFDEIVTYERFIQVIHPDVRERINQVIQDTIHDNKDFDEEMRVIWPDGSLHWITSRGRVYKDQTGRAVRMAGATIDITELKRNQETIQVKDELLRLTGEMAHVGGWEFDTETLSGAWTDEVARIHDLDPQQPTNAELGMSFYRGESRKSIEDAVEKAIKQGTPYDLELEMTTAKGIRKWVRTIGMPVFQGNKIVKVKGIFQDITERKKAEDEIRRMNDELEEIVRERTAELSDLYNNAPCGYHSIDKDANILFINDTELKWLGYTREEVVGKKKIYEFFTPESVTTFNNKFPIFLKQGWINDLEFEIVRKDGSTFPILLSGSAVYDQDGQFVMSRSTMIDHTAYRKTETALRESQAKLVTINKELEAFSYSVSHDLRAPLRRIDGWSQALFEDYSQSMDETAQKYLGRVRAETQYMSALIDDLLELSRVTRADMKRVSIDLSGLAQNIIDGLQEVTPERQVEIVIQPELKTHGDPALLRILLTNLLDNAWKYTGNRSDPRIEFGVTDIGGKTAYYIRDNGVGFDISDADRLFDVFQRLHTVSEFPGTGIGLATVKRIVHRHGGNIWAESQMDHGATFFFTLDEAS